MQVNATLLHKAAGALDKLIISSLESRLRSETALDVEKGSVDVEKGPGDGVQGSEDAQKGPVNVKEGAADVKEGAVDVEGVRREPGGLMNSRQVRFHSETLKIWFQSKLLHVRFDDTNKDRSV